MRKCSESWLSTYLKYTEGQESPELFHLWTGISVLATTLGRNVYLDRDFYKVFPNHYIILLAASAECRKSVAVGIGKDLLERAKIGNISSERITNAGLFTQLGDLGKKFGAAELLIFADELRLFLSTEETHKGVITTLTRLFTCPDYLENKTKTAGVDYLINTCVNVLAATTPADFAEVIPGASLGSGFVPRLHVIHQEIPRPRKAELRKDPLLEAYLVEDLKQIRKLAGIYSFGPGAWDWWKNWYENVMEFPEDETLNGFYGRKHDYVLKLGIILAASERDELVLEKQDLKRALLFLDQIESFMGRAYKSVGTTMVVRNAERVLRQLRKHDGPMKRSEVLHLNSNRLDSQELSEVVRYLEESDEIDTVPGQGGRGVVYKVRRK